MRQDNTIHSVQLLRFVAATLVALFHSQEAFGVHVRPPVFSGESYLFGFGAVGVHIFFVISGFIMVLTSSQPGRPYRARQFFKRRFLRIYPIYWLCVLVYVGVHAAIGDPYHLSPREFVGALLLLPGDSSLLIGPAWTMCFEIFFYACFGLAMMLSLTRGVIVLGVVLTGLVLAGLIVPYRPPVLGLAMNSLMLEFVAGTAIGWLAHQDRLPLRWGPLLAGAGVVLFLGGIWWGYHRLPSAIVWGVPSAVLVLGLVSWERARGVSQAVRRLGRLGDSSYVLYLIHVLLITLAIAGCKLLPPSLVPMPLVAAPVIALAAIALAEAIHRRIERPMLALFSPKRSLVPSRQAPAQQPELG